MSAAATGDAGTAATPGRHSLAAAWYGLAVLITASTFALVATSLFSLQVEPLKRSLALSDTDVGVLSGLGLTLTTSIASFPISWLADRSDRGRLLAACVLAWSVAAAACGLARSFGQLFLCVMGVGIAEAVVGPIGYTLVADLFPRRLWIVANYVNSIASLLGSGAVLALAGLTIGFIDANHASLPKVLSGMETWRAAMIAGAVPGPLIAVAILLIRRTSPPKPGGNPAENGVVAYFRHNRRTAIGVFGGMALAVAGLAAVASWTAVVAIRTFGETPQDVGVRLGLSGSVASVVGVLGSAWMVRRLAPRLGRVAPLMVGRIGIGCACLTTPMYLLAGAAWQLYVIAAVQTAVIMACLSAAPTIFQFMAPRHIRARVITLGGMAGLLLRSLAPVTVGSVSDMLPAGPGALLNAMVLVSLPCFVAASVMLRVAQPSLLATLTYAEQGE